MSSSNNNNEKAEEQKNEVSLSRYKEAPKVVLENVGNSSYMNSVLQCLGNIRSIIKYYLTKNNDIKKKIQELPISYGFSRIIFQLYPFPEDSLKKSFSLKTFQRTIAYYNRCFKGENCKSPKDFLIYLLENLHKEDKLFRSQKKDKDDNDKTQNGNKPVNKSFKEYLQYLIDNEKSIISDNFCWINQKIKKCQLCSTEDISYQNFFSFELNLVDAINNMPPIDNKNNIREISIIDCIQNQLNNKVIKMYCPKCKQKCDFQIKKSISFAPDVFILLNGVKEPEEVLELMDQKNISFNFSDDNVYTLDLSKIIKDANSNKSYSLQAVVCSQRITSGSNEKDCGIIKYIAFCKSPIDSKWYRYEDNTVSIITQIQLSVFVSQLFPEIFFFRQEKNE
jgi:ubiquitin C-terminal hydrolase